MRATVGLGMESRMVFMVILLLLLPWELELLLLQGGGGGFCRSMLEIPYTLSSREAASWRMLGGISRSEVRLVDSESDEWQD